MENNLPETRPRRRYPIISAIIALGFFLVFAIMFIAAPEATMNLLMFLWIFG